MSELWEQGLHPAQAEVHEPLDREEIDAQRVDAGVCRHCGGALPCWSEFGDVAVGRRWTTRDRELASRLARFDRKRWRGTRETGVMPNTADAIIARGWLERAHEKGGRRLVYRLTEAGERAGRGV